MVVPQPIENKVTFPNRNVTPPPSLKEALARWKR